MKRELLQHKLPYLILILGLSILTLIFLGVWPNRVLQRLVIISLSLFYMTWGIVTHLHKDTITRRIVYEYISIGLLAGVLLFLVTI
jgi:hypothetical protein